VNHPINYTNRNKTHQKPTIQEFSKFDTNKIWFGFLPAKTAVHKTKITENRFTRTINETSENK
jgi:hypothetical protein